jgi:putative peptidoglycan lipid II flippase
MSGKLLKSTAVVSAMTLISRISGLIRDVVMANLLGSGALADAFFVAFRIPNFLRRIFGEGAFSQAFVPVFTELNERNTQDAKQYLNAICAWLGLATFVLSVLGVLFAPYIVYLFAPGFAEDPLKFDATVSYLQIMFPYLFCISLVAMSAGVLNSLNRFAVPAATPVVLNICMILSMWWLSGLVQHDVAYALAIGVMVAGGVQLLVQLPALIKEGYLPRPSLVRSNPHVKKTFTLMLPAVFSVSVAQINTLVNTFLASFLVTGSVSWLYYSDRLMEFPVGVFGIALATVVLPSLSKVHTSGSNEDFSQMMDWALRWVVLISVPATVALVVLAVPLLSTIFEYNAFTNQDVLNSALALKAFALGVCGFILVKVLAPGFFARQDTKTPMRIAVIAVLSNIVLSLILVRYLQHTGLALAISLAAWVNAALLYVTLRQRKFYTVQSGWLIYLLKIALATAVMLAFLIWYAPEDAIWTDWQLFERVSRLAVLVIGGGLSYLLALLVLGIRPRQLLLKPTYAQKE